MSGSLREIRTGVEQNGLVSTAAMAEFVERHRKFLLDATGKQIAERLVRAELLTRWQAKFVLQGKAELLTLGSYILLDRIGAGGMGVVFKARHRTMDRIVAIKTLHPEVARRKQTTARFYREVKAAAKLVDPNIVTAYDAGHERDMHFLVMEYVDGRDLGVIVKENGPIPYRQAIELILQAARGLQHAHQQGMVHRDIKPSNLLLDRRGMLKVLDLGLARLTSDAGQTDADEDQMTQAGQVMGTVDFMAPEQAENMSTVDGRADIYSLGCTLYYMVNGCAIFSGKSVINKMLAHQQQPVPPLGSNEHPVPKAIEAAYRRMVAKQKDDRFSSMHDVVTALETTLRAEDVDVASGEMRSNDAAQQLAAAAEQTRAELPAYSELSEMKAGLSDGTLDLEGSSGMSLPWDDGRRNRIGMAQWVGLAIAAAVVCGAIILIKPPPKQTEFSRSNNETPERLREPRVFHATEPRSESSVTDGQSLPRAPQAENSFSL